MHTYIHRCMHAFHTYMHTFSPPCTSATYSKATTSSCHVCRYWNPCIHTYKHKYIRSRLPAPQLPTLKRPHIHVMHTHSIRCTCTHACINKYMHTYIHTFSPPCTSATHSKASTPACHVCTYWTKTRTHTCIDAYTHTYIHHTLMSCMNMLEYMHTYL